MKTHRTGPPLPGGLAWPTDLQDAGHSSSVVEETSPGWIMSSLHDHLFSHTKLGLSRAVKTELHLPVTVPDQRRACSHGIDHPRALKSYFSSEKVRGSVIFVSSAPVLMVLKDQTLYHRSSGHPSFPGHGHEESKQGWQLFAAPAASCPISPVVRAGWSHPCCSQRSSGDFWKLESSSVQTNLGRQPKTFQVFMSRSNMTS